MRKLNLLVTFFFICCQTIAGTQDCFEHARNHGDGLGKRVAPLDCPDRIADLAKPKLKRSAQKGSPSLFAHKNMLYHAQAKTNLWAGSNTLLEDLVSIRKSKNELFVLSKKSGILVFLDFLNGNVAPIRQVQIPEIDFAKDIDADEESIYLLQNDHIIVLNREANSKRRVDLQKLEVIKRINLPEAGAKAFAIDSTNSLLYVLFKNRVLKINLVTTQHSIVPVSQDISKKVALEFYDHLIIK